MSALGCAQAGSYTTLDFARTTLVQSNLGGQGGRCVTISWGLAYTEQWQNLCSEPQPGTAHSDVPASSVPASLPDRAGVYGNEHVLFRGLGSRVALNAQGQEITRDTIWCAAAARAHTAVTHRRLNAHAAARVHAPTARAPIANHARATHRPLCSQAAHHERE